MRSALFVFIFLLVPFAAQAMNCPVPAVPRVSLQRTDDPVKYDFGQNRASLNQLGSTILAAQRMGSTSYVGGLTNGSIASNMSTQLQTLTSPDGTACMWISDITITLHYQPVVYVSREFVQGSCYHDAVLEHEHKHVAMDESILASFAPELQQAIQAAAQTDGHRGPMAAAQLQNASRDLQNIMEVKLNAEMDKLSANRETHQMMIDTPQEYARVQSLCRNWP